MRFEFSLYYLSDDSFPEEAFDLIRHEYAHFANFCLYHGTGHDRMWRKCCTEVGAVATRCYSGIFNDYFNQRKIQKAKAAEICNDYDVGSVIKIAHLRWLFTSPLIQFLSRSMNDSKNTPHFHFKGCHFHFKGCHFHFRGCHFHFEEPHFHFTLITSCQTFAV